MFLTLENFKKANARIDAALNTACCDLTSVRRSMMMVIFGHNDAALREKIEARGRTREELQQRGIILV